MSSRYALIQQPDIMNQFYIRLRSNFSMNFNPENRTSSYKTVRQNSPHGTMGTWIEGNIVPTLMVEHRRVGR